MLQEGVKYRVVYETPHCVHGEKLSDTVFGEPSIVLRRSNCRGDAIVGAVAADLLSRAGFGSQDEVEAEDPTGAV